MRVPEGITAYHDLLTALPIAFVALWAGFAIRIVLRTRALRWVEPDLMRALLYAALLCAIGSAITDPWGVQRAWAAVLVCLLTLVCWDDWRRWRR